jgi:hypothetical protein
VYRVAWPFLDCAFFSTPLFAPSHLFSPPQLCVALHCLALPGPVFPIIFCPVGSFPPHRAPSGGHAFLSLPLLHPGAKVCALSSLSASSGAKVSTFSFLSAPLLAPFGADVSALSFLSAPFWLPLGLMFPHYLSFPLPLRLRLPYSSFSSASCQLPPLPQHPPQNGQTEPDGP